LIGKSAHIHTFSREEFIAMTDTAEKEGVFEGSETAFIKNLLLFKNVLAKDIMTPFSVVITEDEETSIEEFYSDNKHLKHSRIPIYKDRSNNITGFILKDDVLEEMIDQKGPEPLSSLKREVLTTFSETPIPDLFEILIEKRAHITIVSDEYGNPVGIVTMEDIIETLLGLEIMDESDNVADMQAMARKNWEIRAKRLGIINPKSDTDSK
jgi:CBS domain containing-hemolysin-like protein